MIKTKSKVWMIIPTYFPVFGGAQSQVRTLSEVLSQDSCDVEIVTRRNFSFYKGQLLAEEIINDVKITRISSKGFWKIATLNYVINTAYHLIKNSTKNPIYHVHAQGSSLIATIIANLIRPGKIVLKFRSGLDIYENQNLFSEIFFNILAQQVDTFCVLNNETMRYLAKRFPKKKIVQLNNRVDQNIFYPLDPSLDIKSDYKNSRILYTGRLEKDKGVSLLCEAFEILFSKYQGLTLELIGDGSLKKQILNLGKSLDNSITISQSINLSSYYQNSDIFVLASFSEGMSNSLLEAMSSGMIVVSSNVGAAPEIIEHGKNGFLFENQNLQALVDILEGIIQGNLVTYNLRKQAISTINKAYSNKNLLVAINQIYLN